MKPIRRPQMLLGLINFEAAARCGSFASAAIELGVSASAVSQQVKLLEDRLGVRLFERRPQSLEKHRERGSLPATIKVVQAARKAKNFVSFNWIGYTIFREGYPQSEFDKVQYESWTSGLNFSPEKKKWDDELVGELQALVKPGDNQFNEMALQTAFVGTQLPLDLSRKGVKVLVLTGIHLDWCIEGNARAARDNGYLPIVIGDACGCQKPEQEAAAMERINNFFAPVISADTFVKLLNQST
jgi:nicotinamidase-related amidase